MNEITTTDNLEVINGIRLMKTNKQKKVQKIKTHKTKIQKERGTESLK